MAAADARTFHLLYVSSSSLGVDVEVAMGIAATSRQRNLSCSISGALLFDGRRFSQLLEGSESAVLPLFELIKVDPRHGSVIVNATAHLGLPRLTNRWRFALCDQEVLDPLMSGPGAVDEVAIALFMSALASSTVV